MKKLILGLTLGLILLYSGQAWAADKVISWDASPDATGYKVYVYDGTAWDTGTDVGGVLTYTVTIPDTGLVLVRIDAYNANGDSVPNWRGVWYWGDLKPPDPPGSIGIQ